MAFRYWLGRRTTDDKRQVNRWKRVVSRFKGKLIKMIKNWQELLQRAKDRCYNCGEGGGRRGVLERKPLNIILKIKML